MKVLILSCNTGQGHNSAAYAVRDMFISLGHECDSKDALAYASEIFSKGVSSSYNSIVMHTPKAFGVGYRFSKSKKYKPGKTKSAFYAMNMVYSKKLYLDILKAGYDAVLCTHVFAAQSMTHVKHKHGLNIPVYVIATDYSFCPYYDELDVDKYFISLESVRHEFLARGIPEDKILPTGIPVSEKFSNELTKTEAREHLQLSQDKFICVIMSGSMGFGNIYSFIDSVLELGLDGYEIIVIAGNNTKLKDGINEKYADKSCISAIGYTKEVHFYMKACDLVVSKPGGLSSTEAMVSNVPLILTSPIPGCESENYQILTDLGAAVGGNTHQEAAQAFKKIMTDKAFAEKVRLNQRTYINANSAKDICSHVLSRAKAEAEVQVK